MVDSVIVVVLNFRVVQRWRARTVTHAAAFNQRDRFVFKPRQLTHAGYLFGCMFIGRSATCRWSRYPLATGRFPPTMTLDALV